MSTTIKSFIIPTYAAAAKKQPSVGAASARVAVSIPIPTAKQPTIVVSPSPNAVGQSYCLRAAFFCYCVEDVFIIILQQDVYYEERTRSLLL